ncbi:triacylglycerol lipase [Nakamurella sp. UYEF19]|uniref:esterase/lipase family protein n=1 Tax=Nakamurella sp. UYEF19 TaxID=1756392 RepID=UPI003399AE16
MTTPSTPTATPIPASTSSQAAPGASTAPSDPPAGRAAVTGLPSVGVTGVNVADCRSTQRPVVLLHGTFSTVASNFSALVPALLAGGRCVYGLDYGNGGIAAVTASGTQFADLVGKVRKLTGADQVDVIGYSQGGLVLRTALRLNGLADQVSTAVLLAPSWNGTTAPLAGALPANLCRACADQVAGSPLLRRLAVGGDLDGRVRYAELSTRGDTVVTPIGSQVPSGPADRVRALVVQDQCPTTRIDHVQLPAARGVISWVVSALNTDGRPPPAAMTC